MILAFALIETERPQSSDYLVIDVPRHAHEIFLIFFVASGGTRGAQIPIAILSRFAYRMSSF
jgi:hypothetical protein